jgi:hypothetical protein
MTLTMDRKRIVDGYFLLGDCNASQGRALDETPILTSRADESAPLPWLTEWVEDLKQFRGSLDVFDAPRCGVPQMETPSVTLAQRLMLHTEGTFNILRAYPDELEKAARTTSSYMTFTGFALEPVTARTTPTISPGVASAGQGRKVDANRAVAAVADLQSWLSLTVDEVARLVGCSRSALLYWKRANAMPRPGIARNLYRVHALIRALASAMAPGSPLGAMTHSPDGGGPSAYDLLRMGRYDEAEQLLRPLIFRRQEQPIQRPRLVHWEEDESRQIGLTAPPLSAPVRRAHRVTLPK